jgi:transposase
LLASIKEMGSLAFPISSRARETMMLYIEQYTKTESLYYYTDDWFAYTSLPVSDNHVVVLKQKGIPKGGDHLIYTGSQDRCLPKR